MFPGRFCGKYVDEGFEYQRFRVFAVKGVLPVSWSMRTGALPVDQISPAMSEPSSTSPMNRASGCNG